MPIPLPPSELPPGIAIYEVIPIKKYPFKLSDSSRLISQNLEPNLNTAPLEALPAQQTQPESTQEIPQTFPAGIPSLNGQAQSEFNSRAIWGPIQAGLVHDPKQTFGNLFSDNVGNLSKSEFKQLKKVLDFIVSNPSSRQRFVELTQISEEDLDYARENLDRSKFVFTKLLKLAITTSTQRRVSTQIGGLMQFIEETKELNGTVISEEYKFKLIRGIPETAELAWSTILDKCSANLQECKARYVPLMDMNGDGNLDATDVALANASIQQLKARMHS
ncbi:MAG: hypothetical protein SFU25_08320 [Candidatus Caenarcaniphilales bacterium]|nr:hypothetical protein [Candidatus Caenarcaniphilales bacterium]